MESQKLVRGRRVILCRSGRWSLCCRFQLCRSVECDGWDKMKLAIVARELLSIPVIMRFWENLRPGVTRFLAFKQIWCHYYTMLTDIVTKFHK